MNCDNFEQGDTPLRSIGLDIDHGPKYNLPAMKHFCLVAIDDNNMFLPFGCVSKLHTIALASWIFYIEHEPHIISLVNSTVYCIHAVEILCRH